MLLRAQSRCGLPGSTRSILDRVKFTAEFDARSLRLAAPYARVYAMNPHLREVFANRAGFVAQRTPLRAEQRRLPDDLERNEARTPYARRTGRAKTTEHWGQRYRFARLVMVII